MRLMKNKKICTILASTMICLSAVNVYAKPIDELYVSDLNNNEITVKGSGFEPNSTVSLFVAQKDVNLENATEQDIQNGYFQLITVDEEGKYTHKFQFDGSTDTYKAYIGKENTQSSAIDSFGEFGLVSLTDLDTAVSNIANNVTAKDDIYDSIKDFGVVFDVDFSFFNSNSFVKEEINTIVDASREEIKTGGVGKLKEKITLVKNRRDFLESLSKVTLAVEVANILGSENYNAKYDLDLTSYNALKNGKDTVCQGLIATYDKYDDFVAKLAQLVSEQANAPIPIVPSTPSGITGNSGGGFSYGGGSSSSTTPSTPTTPEQNVVFSDVASDHWAFESIKYLKNKNIISGYDGMFNPQSNITREELMKMIVTAFNLDTNGNDCDFSDLDKNHWAYPYVATAVKHNIAKGMGDGTFGVGLYATREDIAVFVYRALQSVDTTSFEANFADKDNISEYAYEAVSYLNGKKIINGYEDGSFKPKNLCTRAEVAKILYSILEGGVR